MAIMKPEEEPIHPESQIAQLGVGLLEISCQAFTRSKQTQFSHKITIHKDDGGPGWGKKIFAGTLKELVDLIDKSTELSIRKGGKVHFKEVLEAESNLTKPIRDEVERLEAKYQELMDTLVDPEEEEEGEEEE